VSPAKRELDEDNSPEPIPNVFGLVCRGDTRGLRTALQKGPPISTTDRVSPPRMPPNRCRA
jgi:hypothetical protein